MAKKAILRVKQDGQWVPVPMLVSDDEAIPVVRSYVTVAKKGAMFKTINGAIEYAKTICDVDNRVLVVILDNSIYDEEITLLNNPGIDIAGFGAVIRHNSVYPHSPLYTTGRGTFTGLTFENYNQGTHPNLSYAMHFDYNNPGAQASGETRFVNCRFIAMESYGVGIGMGSDIELIFEDCMFRSTTHGGMYLHNSPFAANNQIVRCNNCQFIGAEADNGYSIVFDDAVDASSGAISPMSVHLTNCGYLPQAPNTLLRSGGKVTTYRGLVETHNLKFSVQGNLIPHYTPVKLDDNTANSFTYVTTTNQNGHATIVKPSTMPTQCTITVLSCEVNDGRSITPEVISDVGQMCAVISTGVPNAVIQMAVRILPAGLI